jgi:hypothetical protein
MTRILTGIIKTIILYNNYIFLISWGIPSTNFIVIDPNIIYKWENNTLKRISIYYLVLKLLFKLI